MKVLYLYLSNNKKKKDLWISKNLPEGEYEFSSIRIPYTSLPQRLIRILFLPVKLNNYDIIVTTEYYLSFFLNMRLLITRCSVKHIVWGLNQSRKLLVFNSARLNKIIAYVFNRLNAIVTHSRQEACLFSKMHNINSDKFKFVHWGYDLPDFGRNKFVDFDGDYICMIGRNNRDWKTFSRAVELSHIKGVAVCSSVSKQDKLILAKSDVTVFEDLNMEECLNIIKHSLANIVLVLDDTRGAGHITVVSSMLLSKPQIISEVNTLTDYFEHNVHGFMVQLHSPEDVSKAIDEIKENREKRVLMGEDSKQYAENWFTSNHIAQEADFLLKAVFLGKRIS